MRIDVEVLTTVINLVKAKVTEDEPPGMISRIKRLKQGVLDRHEEQELYQDYRAALTAIIDHCNELIHDNDWKGNLLTAG